MDDEITTSEAANLLKVMPRQVRWYFEKGLLTGRMIAGRLVFRREDVEQFEKPTKTGRPRKAPETKKGKPTAGKPTAGKLGRPRAK